MSINPFSAGQPSQVSHFPHYGAPAYTYPGAIPVRPSAADPYQPDGEVDARLMESGSQASYLPPHIPQHLSPHISPHLSPSTTPHHHTPYPAVLTQGHPSSIIDKRSKSMTSEAPLSAVQKARKASSPALSRRRKRSDSGDAQSSDKDEAGASGNVTMFQCRGFGDCQMVFTRSEHLARHVRKHTGERPFQCHCGKAFSRLDNLRQHAQTVHAEEQERNELMMQELTSLHSSLAASAAQAQVAHAQVLGKAGPNPSAAFVPMSNGPSVVPARRKSSMTAVKASGVPMNKKRASLANISRRDSIISQSSAPARSNDEAYFADQKEASPASSSYYHAYSEVPMAIAPSSASTTMSNGQSTLMPNGDDHGFQYARPPSSSGAYSTFAHSTFGHGAIPAGAPPQEAPYYGHYDHSALYTGMAPTSSLATSTPETFSHLGANAPIEYNGYAAPLSHAYQHQSEMSEWRNHEVGPRGEEHYHPEGGAVKSNSNFQSTLSAHLAMRAPILRPGRGVSPPPSTSHSLRPGSSSSISPMDRPVLPPLSSLSRPGTGHSNTTGPRSGLMDPSQVSFLFRPSSSSSDDKRPYTSPSEPHLAKRPTLPSVRTTSAVRPGSRGSVLDPPSLFETSKSRMASQLPFEARRATSSAGRESAADRLKASPPTSHSPFRFQPPPLPGQGATAQQGLTSYRPISRDRPLTGNLPSLSTTLDSLKRSRELRGREEDYETKRLRPFTSGDLPPPSSFGNTSGVGENMKQEEDETYIEPNGGARRISIASLVDGHDEASVVSQATSPPVMKEENEEESN